MGGDYGPHCIVPASLQCLAEIPSLHLVLVGQLPLLESLVAAHPAVDHARLRLVHAADVVGMQDVPTQVLRSKADTSMRGALTLVQQAQADACVSAGNTGALMVLSRQLLKTLPGIDRPAMMTALPTERGYCQVLDLGANVDCSAQHLLQFAVMGSVAAEVLGCARPRVALLNIGAETVKGNALVKQAAALLDRVEDLNYIGFVEGDGLYRGEADVVVCDGFVGNVLLKSSEGLANMIAKRLQGLFQQGWWSRCVGLLVQGFFSRLERDIAPSQRNGASFLGLQGIVVKSHGAADVEAFKSAIRRALTEVHEDLPRRLHGQLERYLRPDVTSGSA